MKISVKGIREKFPIKTTPEIIGEPTYKAINEVQMVMYINAASILTTLGGGRNRHIGLIIDAALYANASTTSYAKPTNPVPYAHRGPGDSAAEPSDENDMHKEGKRIYNLDNKVDTAVKKEIIAALEET